MPFQPPATSSAHAVHMHWPLQQSPLHTENRQQQQSNSGAEFQPPRNQWDAQAGLDGQYTLTAYLRRAAAAGELPRAPMSEGAPPPQHS